MRKAGIVLLIFIALQMAGCDKILDIKPTGVRVGEDAVQTPQDLKQLLAGTYDAFRSDQFMGANTWVTAELLSDNLNADAVTSHLQAVYLRNTSVFNTYVRQIWDQGYTSIYRCNLVLKYAEKVNGLGIDEKATIRGQAFFLRAYSHFELVRLFAQPWGYTADNSHDGIPLRLTPTTDPQARNTVKEVYDQIISDLVFAVQLLPASNAEGTPDLYAAKALLAKVYFQQNDFTLALNNAREAVENSNAIFQQGLTNRFLNSTNTDNFFALLSDGSGVTGQQAGALLSAMYASVNVRPPLTYSQDLYNELKRDAGEKRVTDWASLQPASGTNPEMYIPLKFNYASRFRIPLIHLAEIKLIFAECAAETNDALTARVQLNDIRMRAGLSKFTSSNISLLLDEIRHQRRLELVLEGNRVHELKRQAVRSGGGNFFIRGALWKCPGLVLAIPDDEMSANPKMVQNPLGGCN